MEVQTGTVTPKVNLAILKSGREYSLCPKSLTFDCVAHRISPTGS